MGMGRAADAEKVYRELKSVAPDNPQAYQALGGFYEETGERQKAIAEFKSLLASKPKDIPVKQRLIENLIAAGE
jgi:Flp pilus assembly protein TadD